MCLATNNRILWLNHSIIFLTLSKLWRWPLLGRFSDSVGGSNVSLGCFVVLFCFKEKEQICICPLHQGSSDLFRNTPPSNFFLCFIAQSWVKWSPPPPAIPAKKSGKTRTGLLRLTRTILIQCMCLGTVPFAQDWTSINKEARRGKDTAKAINHVCHGVLDYGHLSTETGVLVPWHIYL